jgi:hypothetical protein
VPAGVGRPTPPDRRAYNEALTEMFTTGSTVPYVQFLIDRYDVS